MLNMIALCFIGSILIMIAGFGFFLVMDTIVEDEVANFQDLYSFIFKLFCGLFMFSLSVATLIIKILP